MLQKHGHDAQYRWSINADHVLESCSLNGQIRAQRHWHARDTPHASRASRTVTNGNLRSTETILQDVADSHAPCLRRPSRPTACRVLIDTMVYRSGINITQFVIVNSTSAITNSIDNRYGYSNLAPSQFQAEWRYEQTTFRSKQRCLSTCRTRWQIACLVLSWILAWRCRECLTSRSSHSPPVSPRRHSHAPQRQHQSRHRRRSILLLRPQQQPR